ncbi:MAG: xylose isomerase [Isosphaeraceae bacterium]|jgi:sugar phosphate isomerase/epimerase|nr:MAG: xylose isomerase [Isosphaeraceae bacterium]
MLLGYNTNGLAHHRLTDAIELLADEGYQSVAITLDAGALDPYDDPEHLARQLRAVREALDRRGLNRVVETGARFLLNPRRKHDPTLLDPDPGRRSRRADFLNRAIDLAVVLGASVVSIWSGSTSTGEPEGVLYARLKQELGPILDHAAAVGVVLGFEPEPGMFVDTMERYAELDRRLQHPAFQLTLDIGHVHCLEAEPIPSVIRTWADRIVNVHLEDMVVGVHQHLPLGAGTIDFPPVLWALAETGYRGGVHVELSRQSAEGAQAVAESAAFLRRIWPTGVGQISR